MIKYTLKRIIGENTNLLEVVIPHHQISRNVLLDGACETGSHVQLLKNKFKVMGADINKEMINIARGKVHEVKFVEVDIKNPNSMETPVFIGLK